MEKFVITGTEEGLHGRVKISGAKNAVLPILAACLLTERDSECTAACGCAAHGRAAHGAGREGGI